MIAVYGVGKDYDGTLFSNTQSILRNLAELNRDLQNIINKHFRDSISKASRIATRLLLQYHHVSYKDPESYWGVTYMLLVCRPHDKTPNNVCFTYAHRTVQDSDDAWIITISPCGIIDTIMCQLCTINP